MLIESQHRLAVPTRVRVCVCNASTVDADRFTAATSGPSKGASVRDLSKWGASLGTCVTCYRSETRNSRSETVCYERMPSQSECRAACVPRLTLRQHDQVRFVPLPMTANMALVRSMPRRALPPMRLEVGTLAPNQMVPHHARRLIQLFQPIQPLP